jgi:hypothetical protein
MMSTVGIPHARANRCSRRARHHPACSAMVQEFMSADPTSDNAATTPQGGPPRDPARQTIEMRLLPAWSRRGPRPEQDHLLSSQKPWLARGVRSTSSHWRPRSRSQGCRTSGRRHLRDGARRWQQSAEIPKLRKTVLWCGMCSVSVLTKVPLMGPGAADIIEQDRI